MNRAITALGSFTFFLMLCLPVQAGIQWASGTVSTNFMIVSQGGSFYYPTSPNVAYWINNKLNVPNEHILTEFDTPPHEYPGTATLQAKSSGASLAHGSQVQVYGGISFSGAAGTPDHFDANENGMNVTQSVTANIVREFTNDENTPITIDLRANLTGTINFNTVNYNYVFHFDQNPLTEPILDETYYAYYLLSGQVAIIEHQLETATVNTYAIDIDNNNLRGTIEDIVIQPASEGYYYHLVCALYLESHVKNFHIEYTGFHSYAMDGPFSVGGDSEPISGVRLRASLALDNPLPWLPLLLLD